MFEPSDTQRYRRQVEAMVKAAGRQDPEAFAFIVELLDRARTELVPAACDELRAAKGAAPGFSWADIARPLGVTRQTAQERFGRVPARRRAAQRGSEISP